MKTRFSRWAVLFLTASLLLGTIPAAVANDDTGLLPLTRLSPNSTVIAPANPTAGTPILAVDCSTTDEQPIYVSNDLGKTWDIRSLPDYKRSSTGKRFFKYWVENGVLYVEMTETNDAVFFETQNTSTGKPQVRKTVIQHQINWTADGVNWANPELNPPKTQSASQYGAYNATVIDGYFFKDKRIGSVLMRNWDMDGIDSITILDPNSLLMIRKADKRVLRYSMSSGNLEPTAIQADKIYLSADRDGKKTLLAMTHDLQFIAISNDMGATWCTVTTETMPKVATITLSKVKPIFTNNGLLVLYTDSSATLMTSDSGATWKSVLRGHDFTNIQSIDLPDRFVVFQTDANGFSRIEYLKPKGLPAATVKQEKPAVKTAGLAPAQPPVKKQPPKKPAKNVLKKKTAPRKTSGR
ncbi:MAG: hypothetical protein ACM3QZ_04150 [Solirubrobacterales bacterium]